MALAAIGLRLAHRSRLDPIWRGLCPQCEMIIWLPLRVCPVCGADFGSEDYREAIDLGREEFKRGKRVLLRSSQILILLAWIVLFMGFLIAKMWP